MTGESVQKDATYFRSVLDAVEESGLLLDPRRVWPPHGYEAALDGKVDLDGKLLTLRVALSQNFPQALPSIYLRPSDAVGFVPHVLEESGAICYLDPEGLVIDQDQPVVVIEQAVQRAIDTLAKGMRGTNRADFVDEFEVHWSRLPGGVRMCSVLDPNSEVQRIVIIQPETGSAYVAANESELSAFLNGRTLSRRQPLRSALYLPLEPDTLLIPPRADGPMWTVEEVRERLLLGLSAANASVLRTILTGRSKWDPDHVVVSLPRPSGGTNLFGIRYEGVGPIHPLLEGGQARRVVPLLLSRWERTYLVPRGGGDCELGSRRILVVGCGAVGGHLAVELARSGVLQLTLVDYDHLSPENSFRHVLGRRYWGDHKVEALKQEIEGNLPYVRVRAIPRMIQAALAEGLLNFNDFDLVIFALGNPTVELAMNRHLRASPSAPPTIFTWVEPFGIGGHALLTGHGPSGGCFQCLYTPAEAEGDRLCNRASFAVPDPERPFGRALSGCGSLHTPYGSVDAVRTAALAVRLALDALTHLETGNPLRSWKGDATAYLDAGFALSNRFYAAEDQLFRLRYAYLASSCATCGSGHGDLQ